MKAHQTPDEARAAAIDVMGERAGTIYAQLWQHVAWLYHRWNTYVPMFGTSPSRVDLLNQCSGSFFRVVQDSLWETIVLHIARLNDRAKTNGKKNLTLHALAMELAGTAIEDEFWALTTDAKTKAAFAIDWRNRWLAHLDSALAVGEPNARLVGGARADVRAALSSLQAALQCVANHYFDVTLRFDIGPQPTGADFVLRLLQDGLSADAERRTRLTSGNFLPQDLHPPEI